MSQEAVSAPAAAPEALKRPAETSEAEPVAKRPRTEPSGPATADFTYFLSAKDWGMHGKKIRRLVRSGTSSEPFHFPCR